MNVFLDVDELYPFYSIFRVSGGSDATCEASIELPLETVQHIDKVMIELWEIQGMLAKLHREAIGDTR